MYEVENCLCFNIRLYGNRGDYSVLFFEVCFCHFCLETKVTKSSRLSIKCAIAKWHEAKQNQISLGNLAFVVISSIARAWFCLPAAASSHSAQVSFSLMPILKIMSKYIPIVMEFILIITY